jgi:predicted  nucleic acid-binding Zn-ribbon protein
MMPDFDTKSASFLFGVFVFFTSIFGAAMRWLFGRAIDGLDEKFEEIDQRFDKNDERFEKLEEVIERGAQSRNEMTMQLVRMEERLKSIPSHTQFSDLAKEVAAIQSSQKASANQLDLIVQHILKKEEPGKS